MIGFHVLSQQFYLLIKNS